MKHAEIIELIASFGGGGGGGGDFGGGGPISAKCVIVGDVMLDRFVSGAVSRISPEAPVPILSYQEQRLIPGGAANVARNLTRYGISTTLIGVVGTDTEADLLRHRLEAEAAIQFKAITDKSRPTTVKTRFTSAGQQILRLDHEDSAPLAPPLEKKLLNAAQAALKRASLLVISDYAKGTITHDTAQALIQSAHEAGVQVIADPKNPQASVYQGCRLITPNIHEFCRMTGLPLDSRPLNTLDPIIAAARTMTKQHNIGAILITLGADGMLLVDADKPPQHIHSQAQSVFDVSGAGDTVIASIAAALAGGHDILKAIELANIAAGLVVGKSGTATILPGEILAKIAPPYQHSQDETMTQVRAQVRAWQEQGLSVGFTNGCFDLLHPGHLWLLQQAAKTCQRLVVGLNSDRSVRRLKGAGRPHQAQEHRAAVLASLPFVQAVVIFDDPTPAKLIKALAPDRLIKGGDYKAKNIIGSQTLKKYGGKTIVIPTKKGYSTTRLSKD